MSVNTCGGRAQKKGKERMEGAGETEGRWRVNMQATKVNRVGGKGLKSSVQSEDKEGEQNVSVWGESKRDTERGLEYKDSERQKR